MGPNDKSNDKTDSDKDESVPQSDQYDTHDPNNNQRDTGFGTESGGLGG